MKNITYALICLAACVVMAGCEDAKTSCLRAVENDYQQQKSNFAAQKKAVLLEAKKVGANSYNQQIKSNGGNLADFFAEYDERNYIDEHMPQIEANEEEAKQAYFQKIKACGGQR